MDDGSRQGTRLLMDEDGSAAKALEVTPSSYARWRSSFLGEVTERLEQHAILEAAGDLRGLSVLDAGCGDGAFIVAAWEKGASVSGVDASQAMLEAAHTRALGSGARVDLVHASVEELPFPAGTFDVVVMASVLCTVQNPLRAVSEAARVLRPGGRLVLGELHVWSLWSLSRRLRGWLGNPFWRGVRFWTVGEIRAMVHHAGLSVQYVRGCIYYPPWEAAARLLWCADQLLSHLGTFCAAFLIVRADKE